MAVLGQRRHRDVGDVVGVDEGLARLGRGSATVPLRTRSSKPFSLKFCAKNAERTTVHAVPAAITRLLGLLGGLLAAARQQDEPFDPARRGQRGEGADPVERLGGDEVGVVTT